MNKKITFACFTVLLERGDEIRSLPMVFCDEIKHPQPSPFCCKLAQLGIGIEANATGIGIPASSLSVRYRSILVPDLETLIPVPVSPAFRHYKKLHKGTTSTVGSSVRVQRSSLGAAKLSSVQRSSVGYSIAQQGAAQLSQGELEWLQLISVR